MSKLIRLIFFILLFAFLLLNLVSCAHLQTNFQRKILPRKSFVKVEKSLTISECDESGCTSQLLRSVASGVAVHSTLEGAYILTAAHVCDDSDVKAKYQSSPNIEFSSEFSVRTLSNEQKPVKILEFDIKHDICMVWVKNLFIQPVAISPSEPEPGDRVFNIAAPLGIFSKDMVPIFEGFYDGVDQGGRAVYSIPAIGGSSGSPIFNRKGELIGMVHSTIRYFNQITISPNYKAMREFINETIGKHSFLTYFRSIWRPFMK